MSQVWQAVQENTETPAAERRYSLLRAIKNGAAATKATSTEVKAETIPATAYTSFRTLQSRRWICSAPLLSVYPRFNYFDFYRLVMLLTERAQQKSL